MIESSDTSADETRHDAAPTDAAAEIQQLNAAIDALRTQLADAEARANAARDAQIRAVAEPVGWELVEYNPGRDVDGRTAALALRILETALR